MFMDMKHIMDIFIRLLKEFYCYVTISKEACCLKWKKKKKKSFASHGFQSEGEVPWNCIRILQDPRCLTSWVLFLAPSLSALCSETATQAVSGMEMPYPSLPPSLLYLFKT